jgi:hypothetical protein
MSSEFSYLAALAAGLTINVVDVGCTLLFAARPWETELRRQGLEPRRQTPPYYVLTNFVGGFLLAYVYVQFSKSMGDSVGSAAKASLVVWLATRIYGGGHVVMGQMPARIFVVMSTGLGVGYLVAGAVLRTIAS